MYFGITSILSLTRFYNPEETTIRLSVNTDGTPPFHSVGYNFWPILAAVDKYPEWMIALYGGRSKPKCSNEFLNLFVREVLELKKNGIRLHNRTYKLELLNMLMDIPATTYVLGTKGHGGYYACRRCHTKGESVTLAGRVNKKGGACQSVYYPQMDAPERTSDDFTQHFDLVGSDPHVSGRIISDIGQDDISDNSDEDDDPFIVKRGDVDDTSFWEHHRHPTILTKLKFDLVKNIPYEYMHAVCSGIMRMLLLVWTTMPVFLKKKAKVSDRLMFANAFCPFEFQRWPDTLNNARRWKASQYRVFILYTGVFALKDLLNQQCFRHFSYLVVALRLMCRTVPRNAERQSILENIAKFTRPILRKFMTDGIKLYGKNFATLNVHAFCCHTADDYERFGSLDEFSVFRFESFLGWLKSLVLGPRFPLQQIINAYSTFLLTGNMRKADSVPLEYMQEYFEYPEFKEIFSEGDWQAISEIKYRSLTLRTDNHRDRHLYINGSFVRLTKIVHQVSTARVLLCGRRYEHVTSIFDEPVNSIDVGLAICSQLSEKTESWELELLQEKCFAFPLSADGPEWAMARYLH